jgi:hypothetical protein
MSLQSTEELMGQAIKGIAETSAYDEESQERTAKYNALSNSTYTGALVHNSFPSMGVIHPSHLGSASMSPTKGEGDYEERLPSKFMSENYYNRTYGNKK